MFSVVYCQNDLFQQEYFEPKRAFKCNELKGLVNFSRDNWTDFDPVDTWFKGISTIH